tara:strand:- start:23004 stop:23873 length:870 start_codon:yes stop_codon:yes gene_type:complete
MWPDSVSWTSADGLKLYAQDHIPEGPQTGLPVLCIPGLTRNSRDFSDIAPRIAAQGRRVLAVDLRGRGLSGRARDPRTYRPDIYAADMASLLDALGIARAHVVGTSLGGIVAMAMAGRHSDRVAGAVLNDIGPAADPAGLARIASYAGSAPKVANWDDAAGYARHINGAAFPDYADADWMVFATRMFRENAEGIPVLDYDPAIFKPVPGWAMPVVSLIMWRQFRKLARQRPVLVLRGARSDILAAKTVAAMRRAAPHLQTAEIPGVGHAPDLSEPASLAALDSYFAAVD